MAHPFTASTEELKNDLDNLLSSLRVCEKELEQADQFLRCFQCDGFDNFRERVLIPRLDRNAHRSMSLVEAEAVDDSTELRMRDRLQGQYNECQWMCGAKVQIQAEITVLQERRHTLKKNLEKTTKAIEKHQDRSK